MANYLDQTWLAYALKGPAEEGMAARGLERVERHFQRLYPEPLGHDACGDATLGMALWQRPNEHLRAPLWATSGSGHVASTSPLTGWRPLVGDASVEDAPGLLGQELLARPEAAFTLNPPFVLAVHSGERLVIVNDAIGTGRLFELEWDGGWAWSNRLGALHIFAGAEPRADERAWGVLAATGWFLGELTAIEDVRQLRPASVVEATRAGQETTVAHRRGMDALGELVGPRRKRLGPSAREAAEGARELLRDVGDTYSQPLDVDLSGGRDSRVSSAAAIAVGADAEFRTADLEFGELDVVNELLEAAPSPVRSRVEDAEREPDDSLLERAANLHLAHDGMRNPQSLLRTPMPIPHPPRARPSVSGHGGELGHGFYYGNKKALKRLQRGGDEALAERLLDAARKKRGAAQPAAYTAYAEEVQATLAEGSELGLEGPALLDYYYLSQRLANRSGLTTRNDRWSACSSLGFVRACFDLSPEQRLEGKMHRLIIGELVPEWKDVPFFEAESAPLRETKQVRIWDKPGHSEELARIIAEDSAWHEIFQPDVIRSMWDEARAGEARNYYEPAFTRVVWRTSFERHLDVLRAAA
jgi:hypothetical protein